MPNTPATTATPESIDLGKRVKEFNAELIPLLGKYKVGLGAEPFILPDGRVGAKPTLFDDSKKEKEDVSKVETPSPKKENDLEEA